MHFQSSTTIPSLSNNTKQLHFFSTLIKVDNSGNLYLDLCLRISSQHFKCYFVHTKVFFPYCVRYIFSQHFDPPIVSLSISKKILVFVTFSLALNFLSFSSSYSSLKKDKILHVFDSL